MWFPRKTIAEVGVNLVAMGQQPQRGWWPLQNKATLIGSQKQLMVSEPAEKASEAAGWTSEATGRASRASGQHFPICNSTMCPYNRLQQIINSIARVLPVKLAEFVVVWRRWRAWKRKLNHITLWKPEIWWMNEDQDQDLVFLQPHISLIKMTLPSFMVGLVKCFTLLLGSGGRCAVRH